MTFDLADHVYRLFQHDLESVPVAELKEEGVRDVIVLEWDEVKRLIARAVSERGGEARGEVKRAELDALARKVESLTAEQKRVSVECERAASRLQRAEARAEELSTSCERLAHELTQSETRRADLAAQCQQLTERQSRLVEETDEQAQDCAIKARERDFLRDERDRLAAECDRLAADAGRLGDACQKLNRERSALQQDRRTIAEGQESDRRASAEVEVELAELRRVRDDLITQVRALEQRTAVAQSQGSTRDPGGPRTNLAALLEALEREFVELVKGSTRRQSLPRAMVKAARRVLESQSGHPEPEVADGESAESRGASYRSDRRKVAVQASSTAG